MKKKVATKSRDHPTEESFILEDQRVCMRKGGEGEREKASGAKALTIAIPRKRKDPTRGPGRDMLPVRKARSSKFDCQKGETQMGVANGLFE